MPRAAQDLKILTEAGLVEGRREGQFHYYRMLREVLKQYYQALDAALQGEAARPKPREYYASDRERVRLRELHETFQKAGA